MGEGSATGEPWGAWRSRGYGWLLNVDASGFTISDVTAISHAVVDQGAPGSFHQAFEVLERDGADGLSLRQRGDVTTYVFDRVAPAVVSRPDAADANPVRNFDILWRQFHDHYAFFERRGVDWGEAYARLRPEVEAEGGSDALWDRAAELVAPLKDAHVTIAGGGRVLDVTSPIRERKLVMQRALGVPAWSLDRRAYTHGVGAAFNTLFLGGGGRLTSNGMLLYGEVAPGVGYLAVFGEFGHADTDRSRAALDLPRPRLGAAVFLADEIEGLRRGLDEVVGALSGMNALIVDVRLNYGGYDRLALHRPAADRLSQEDLGAWRGCDGPGDQLRAGRPIARPLAGLAPDRPSDGQRGRNPRPGHVGLFNGDGGGRGHLGHPVGQPLQAPAQWLGGQPL